MADISKINGYEIKDKTARDNHEALVEELNETIDGINEALAGLEYTLPVATSTALGGIKIGYTASGANLPVALSSEKAYVAVTKTAVTTALGYTPPESNTDTKVTQTKTTSASSMPLLLAPAGQTATTTTTANFTNNIYAVPSTGRLYVTGSSNPLFGIQATNGTAFFLQAQTDKLFLGPTSAKALTFTGSTGAISMPNNLTVTGTISEGGTTLANKYLGISAKASSATVADSANSVAWGNVSGKPTFATVATSGSYNDLTNKPTIPSAYTLPLAASGTRGGVQIGYSESGANLALKLSSEKGYVTLSKTSVTTALGYTPPQQDTTYSVATASKAGLVKPVSVITKPTLNSVTTTSGKYYQVQMSSDGNMFVNVPWQAGSSVDLSGYATLASPTFTGTPKAPTAAKGTNTTQIATTAFVNSQGFVTSEVIDDLVDKQELEGGTVNLSAYNFAGQKDNPNLTYYATDNGTTTAGTWLGKNDNVTALFDGLSVNYKVTKAGASTTTFNLNGLGAKTVYLRGTTKLTTQYEVGTIINMSYNSTTGAWYVADYDANSYAYLRQYYTLTTTDGEYPIIYSYTTDTGTSSYKTAYGAVCGRYTYNPSTDTVRLGAWSISGDSCSITNVDEENNYIYIGDDLVEISGMGIGLYGDTTIAGQEYVDISANEIRLNGTVTVNGEPIGSGGGSTLYRHNIEITATFNGKSHVGGIFVYDTRSTKHTPESLYDMYSGQALNFSGFFGNQSGPYAFVGVIHLNGSGSDAVSGLWSQAGNTTVLMMSPMTFTINDENYILTPV